MTDIDDIKDRESLEGWLRDQSRWVSVAIANRVALQVVPQWRWYYENSQTKSDAPDYTLALFRCALISAVATLSATADMKIAAAAAVANAAYANVGNAAAVADASIWAEIRSDSQRVNTGAVAEDLLVKPIWSAAEPEGFAEAWSTLATYLRDDAADWSFWLRWYGNQRDGGEMDAKMLEEIVFLPNEDWDKGPVHLNGLIAGIGARYAPKSPDPENLPPAKRKLLKQQIHLLLQTAAGTEVTALGMSQQKRIVLDQFVNAEGGPNRLPEELEIYESICISFANIGYGIHRPGMDKARVEYLEKRVLELEGQIGLLTKNAGSAVENDFLDKVSDATAISIGTAIGPVIVGGAAVILTNYVDPGALNQLANHFSSYVTNRAK